MDKLRKVLNGEEDGGESGLVTNVTGGGDSMCPSLSWETRIKGFIVCCVLGIVVSLIGAFMLFIPSLTAFALLYTFGTLIALASTLFLRGPVSQFKGMFKETRLFATILLFLMIILTICSAVWWKIAALALLFCFLQFLAFTWYSISYIPFARDAVKKCFSSCLS